MERLFSIRVAAYAVSQVFQRHFLLNMFRLNRARLVLVAAITCVGCIGARMAGRAGYLTLTSMVQWKAMHLEPGWRPGFRRVTILAAQSKNASMNCRLGVALHTFGRCTMVNPVLVTTSALNLSV